jgi:hypothetical protein
VRLLAECRRLKHELLGAGGATIDTPAPPVERPDRFPISARTVVQPDGDIVCLMGDRYPLDPDLRLLHAERVSAWFESMEATVTTTGVALRRAGLTLGALVLSWSGFWAAHAASLLSGLAMLVVGSVLGLLAHTSLRLAVGHAVRGAGARR